MNVLRGPWLATFAHKKLADGIAQRDEGAVELGKVLDTIGPLGELQFPGDKFKPLQVIQFLSYDDPVTAVLSDKSVIITCKFSTASKLAYEASSGRMAILKGGVIKPTSYQIHFLGVDGKLFWKGITHEDQIAAEPISRKASNRAKQAHRSNVESVITGSGAGGTKTDFPTPEPVLYIDSFTLYGSEGSAIWGSPTSISLKADVENLLKKLPRKRYTKEETPVGFGQGCQPVGTAAESPLQRKAQTRAKGQRNGNSAQGTSRKNTLPKLPKLLKSTHDSGGEIHSQPEINGNAEEESQLAFTTQAPGCFSTYDDLEFSTQAVQGNKTLAKATSSPLPNSSQFTGHSPRVVIITKPQQRENPRQTKASVEKKKKPSGKPKLINYSDGTGFDGSTAGSVVNEGRSKKMSGTARNRHKREFKRWSSSLSESGSVDGGAECDEASAKISKVFLANRGWQGMTGVAKEDTIIPKNQQELLERPESWYPNQTNQSNQINKYTSGYSLIPNIQPIPKSHPPRNRVMPLPDIPVTPTQPSSITSSEDEDFPWPSSPVRPPERDINAMPPDSSMPSGSQFYHAGRWSTSNHQNAIPRSTQGTSTEDSSYIPQQNPTPLEARFEKKSSPIGSPSGTREDSGGGETSGDVALGKRVTRAANGISKKTPVDPNNVEPSRMARANQKIKVSVARKRCLPESESEESSEESESSEDELINDPDLPFAVVNPNGRTRVAMFGGILKAQQVELWEKRKKTACDPEGNSEDETWSDEDGIQSGYDGHTSDEEPASDESSRKINGLKEAVRGIVEPVAAKPNIQDTSDHPDSPRLHESGNHPMKTVTEEERSSKAVSTGYYSDVIGHLLSSGPTVPGVEDNAPELTPGSVKPPVARQDIDADDEDELPQAPLMPLNTMAGAKAKISSILKRHSSFIDRPKEMSAKPGKIIPGSKPQASDNSPQLRGQSKAAPGDSLSTAILLQTSSASVAPDVPCSQNSFKTPPSLTSSPSRTAPTVQVAETPYRKGGSGMRNSQSLSPAISRTHAVLGYFQGESDDITLIPGTNMEELRNSSASTHIRAGRPLTPEQDSSPPEGQIPLDCIPSSAEADNQDTNFPDDFSMSQWQLQREMQQRTEIEVPATSEIDSTRVQCAQSQPPSRRLSKTRKLKRLIKSVDFQSQEIRAANAHSVSSMLEQQKRQFLGLDGYASGGPDSQGDRPPPMGERLGKEPGTDVPKSLAHTIRVKRSPASASSVRSCMSIGSDDEDVYSNISRLNTRKRHQSPPSDIPKPTKKLRADDESTYGTSHTSPPGLPPHRETRDRVETPTDPRNEPSRVESEDEDPGEAEPEPNDDDIMAGFPAIDSLIDDAPEPPRPPQIPSKPEIYAGIRERHLDVPGYEKLTDDQMKELDRRRQEYFGITPRDGTRRLFSVQLQRAMQIVPPSPPLRKRTKSLERRETAKTVGDEWYRDENTPLKVFYRKFKELKQVKAELESGKDGSGA